MQYAGTHLKTPLFVVLGHEGCGAVQAALQAKFHGARDRSRIEELAAEHPARRSTASTPSRARGERMHAAVEANVRWTMRRIRATPEAQAREAEGIMKLVGAVLSLSTGARPVPRGVAAWGGGGRGPAGGVLRAVPDLGPSTTMEES